MPLLDPSSDLPDEQLDPMIGGHVTAIGGLIARLEDPEFVAKEPLPIRTAVDLGRDTLAIIARASGPGVERATKIALVNLAYSTMQAMIDMMKMHSDLPKVPRG